MSIIDLEINRRLYVWVSYQNSLSIYLSDNNQDKSENVG